MNSSRRRFLFQSIAAAGVAATGRMFWIESEEFVPEIFINDEQSWLFLEPDDRLILGIITPVILQGVMPNQLSGKMLVSYLQDFDKALTLLTESQQQEFKELLSLLQSMIGRVVMGGIWSSWNNVSAQAIDKMLQNWRNSYLDLIKAAYIGLKELSYASWYGNPQSWQGIGYPGPPEIHR